MGFLLNHVCSDAVHSTVCGCYVHRVPGWITEPFLGVHTAFRWDRPGYRSQQISCRAVGTPEYIPVCVHRQSCPNESTCLWNCHTNIVHSSAPLSMSRFPLTLPIKHFVAIFNFCSKKYEIVINICTSNLHPGI